MSAIKINSKRFHRKFDAEIFQRPNEKSNDCVLIISHTSLKNIFYKQLTDEERPKISFDMVDLTKLPAIPPMFAVKAVLNKDDVCIEQYGEMLCDAWINSDVITKNNPLAICSNRAFDKCVILYLQLEIEIVGYAGLGFYSSEEIPLDGRAIPVNDFNELTPSSVNKGQNTTQNNSAERPQNVQQNTPQNGFGQAVENHASWNESVNGAQDMRLNNRSLPTDPWQNKPPVAPQNEPIHVRRVSFEPHFAKSKIETDHGIFFYDPDTSVWESPSVDMQSVDTMMLYDEASRWLGYHLCSFRG